MLQHKKLEKVKKNLKERWSQNHKGCQNLSINKYNKEHIQV